jgi:glycosyltransferase involved in cell wall biosynthesis
MNTVFFSIVIPTLNEEVYLPKLLQDLTHQTQKSFEVIVVDGKSEDNTKEIALSFAKKLPLRFFSTPTRNVSFQRNYGSQKAKGEYLLFLDADARCSGQLLNKFAKGIQKKGGKLFLPSLIADKNTPQNKVAFQLVNFIIDKSQTLLNLCLRGDRCV